MSALKRLIKIYFFFLCLFLRMAMGWSAGHCAGVPSALQNHILARIQTHNFHLYSQKLSAQMAAGCNECGQLKGTVFL